ncbi:hypothetical protein LX81_03864 [Palleronia aestuarii]|uniref:Uncharacterized protein n=1 Tax=Palleronia aestuarii TaxID=568105 RepID=A0A2W7N025_9RHOB|nr:hypothetical protein [Palleronia aestuarii]PZX11787.1 hypothetical protein LX81_03864 [Palleronia aestuarii]
MLSISATLGTEKNGVASSKSLKAQAWPLFDHIVAEAAPDGKHGNPWEPAEDGKLRFVPDYDVLRKLLGVPLQFKATTQSGIPALALDVWLSYELRRAGFVSDQIWPRPQHPRILPLSVVKLLDAIPKRERPKLEARLARKGAIPGVTSASASILGKNYLKQVDVIMTDWATGPELLISTKRMDSSFGKNAPNRIEESYGDAKNLRLRHPISALGFLFGLRSTILHEEPDTAAWLLDQIGKLGREDDAYHSTCVVLIEYGDEVAAADDGSEPEDEIEDPGPDEDDNALPETDAKGEAVAQAVASLPAVEILTDNVPDYLDPAGFLAKLVTHVLSNTPVNMHVEARHRRIVVGGN